MRVAELAVGGHVLRQEFGEGVQAADDGEALGHHLAGKTLAHLDARAEHGRGSAACEPRHDELVAVQEPEAGVVHVEQPHGLFRHTREQRVGG